MTLGVDRKVVGKLMGGGGGGGVRWLGKTFKVDRKVCVCGGGGGQLKERTEMWNGDKFPYRLAKKHKQMLFVFKAYAYISY